MTRLSVGVVPRPAWADEFRVVLQDLETRFLVRLSPSIEEFDDVVVRDQIVTTQLGDPKDHAPMLRVTRVGRRFLEFIGDPVEWHLRKGARGETPSE